MDPRTDSHERRIEKVEEAVVQFRLELKETVNTVVKWLVGTVSGAALAAITVMTFVLNHGSPKAAPQLPACCPPPHHCIHPGMAAHPQPAPPAPGRL